MSAVVMPPAPQAPPALRLAPELPPGPQPIYLLRHGETDYNAEGIVQGSGVDAPLNAVGRAQAEHFFQRYQFTPFTAIYASGLQRAQQTVAPFEQRGYALQVHPGLNEMSWGIFEGVRHEGEVEVAFRQTLARWAEGEVDYRVPGGESPREVAERVVEALSDILTRHPEGQLLICTHGRAIRIALCVLLGYDLRHMQLFRHRNTALNLLRRVGPHLVAERLSDLSHLPDPDSAK